MKILREAPILNPSLILYTWQDKIYGESRHTAKVIPNAIAVFSLKGALDIYLSRAICRSGPSRTRLTKISRGRAPMQIQTNVTALKGKLIIPKYSDMITRTQLARAQLD